MTSQGFRGFVNLMGSSCLEFKGLVQAYMWHAPKYFLCSFFNLFHKTFVKPSLIFSSALGGQPRYSRGTAIEYNLIYPRVLRLEKKNYNYSGCILLWSFSPCVVGWTIVVTLSIIKLTYWSPNFYPFNIFLQNGISLVFSLLPVKEKSLSEVPCVL